jgi:hypothetical protein
MKTEEPTEIRLFYWNMEADTEHLYLLGVPTLAMLEIFPIHTPIAQISFMASDFEQNYLFSDEYNFDTVGELALFFTQKPDFTFDNLELKTSEGVYLSAHDNSEVNWKYSPENPIKQLINKQLESMGFEMKQVWALLEKYPSHYLQIEKPCTQIAVFEDFEAYLKSR